MKRPSSWLVLLALAAGLSTVLAVRAASLFGAHSLSLPTAPAAQPAAADAGERDEPGDGDDDALEPGEQRVTMDELPTAVKTTIAKEAGQAPVEELKSIDHDGTIVYEATYELSEDQDVELTVAADGKLLEKELETDLSPADLPVAVKQAVEAEVGDGRVEEVKSILNGDVTTYEVTFERADHRDVELTLDKDGKVVEREAEGPDDEGKRQDDD